MMVYRLHVSDCSDSSSVSTYSKDFVQTILLCLLFCLLLCLRGAHKRTQKTGGIWTFLHSKYQGTTFPVCDSPEQVTKYCRCGAVRNLDSLRRLPATRWKKQDMSAPWPCVSWLLKGLDEFCYKTVNCVGWNSSSLANTGPRLQH